MANTSDCFIVKEHVFQGQHIREYPGALAESQEDAIELHAKQYIPRDSSGKGLTLIGFHANGFHKEVYEVFWEELYTTARDKHGIEIASIWMADQAFQGQSASMNEQRMGSDPHWFDHSRDVLAMINTFRKQMTRPIVGVAHSMGASQAVALAQYHPRLFTCLVLVDGALSIRGSRNIASMMKYSLGKPDAFPSRTAAEKAMFEAPIFLKWDRRVLRRYVETAFREGSSPGAGQDKVVALATPKHMEAASLVRPNPEQLNPAAEPLSAQQQYSHPDLDPGAELMAPAYNSPSRLAYSFLPSLRPSTLYINGKGSQIAPPETLHERTRVTGSGIGGSGGVECGRVCSVEVKGGHFLPMTNPSGTAVAVMDWLVPQLEEWKELEAAWAEQWSRKTLQQKQSLPPETVKLYQEWDGKPWNAKPARL